MKRLVTRLTNRAYYQTVKSLNITFGIQAVEIRLNSAKTAAEASLTGSHSATRAGPSAAQFCQHPNMAFSCVERGPTEAAGINTNGNSLKYWHTHDAAQRAKAKAEEDIEVN